MFSKILGKKKNYSSDENKVHDELVQKISKMNLTDMKSFINSNEVNEDVLIEIVKKLLIVDEKTSKRYIEIDDMDSKIKKGFDLILSILNHKKISVVAVELVQKFIDLYSDVLIKYDTENKDIYASRLKDASGVAIKNINTKTEVSKRIRTVN